MDNKLLAALGGLAGGIAGLAGGSPSAGSAQGYSEGIPNLIATRSQVPGAFGPADRRPGQSGRRYFTDVEYSTNAENPIMGGDQLAAMNAAALARQQEYEQQWRDFINALGTQNTPQAPAAAPSRPAVVEPTYVPKSEYPTKPAGSMAPPSTFLTAAQKFLHANPQYGDTSFDLNEDVDFLNAANQAGLTLDEMASALGVSTADLTPRRDAAAAELINRRRAGVPGYAEGGIASLKGYYLGGMTDGMADKVPASIEGKQAAALSDGEFVVPADVVSHLGNGNSNAGANKLFKMMQKVRRARTGNEKQGRQINPNKYLPG